MQYRHILKRRITKAIIVIAIFGFLLYWNPGTLFNGLREVLWFGVKPFAHMTHSFSNSLSNGAHFFSSIRDIREENTRLRTEVMKLQAEEANYQDILHENEKLRAELDLSPRDEYELESALIIGHNPHGIHDWVIINKGTSDGIEEGMPVIVSEGVLVGVVEDALYTTAKVSLLTHQNTTLNAKTADSQVKGIVKGRFGTGMVFSNVFQTDTVQAGEKVITSEIGEKVPAGIYIGKLQEIKSSEDNLFREAAIISPVSFRDLSVVSVIKK